MNITEVSNAWCEEQHCIISWDMAHNSTSNRTTLLDLVVMLLNLLCVRGFVNKSGCSTLLRLVRKVCRLPKWSVIVVIPKYFHSYCFYSKYSFMGSIKTCFSELLTLELFNIILSYISFYQNILSKLKICFKDVLTANLSWIMSF